MSLSPSTNLSVISTWHIHSTNLSKEHLQYKSKKSHMLVSSKNEFNKTVGFNYPNQMQLYSAQF